MKKIIYIFLILLANQNYAMHLDQTNNVELADVSSQAPEIDLEAQKLNFSIISLDDAKAFRDRFHVKQGDDSRGPSLNGGQTSSGKKLSAHRLAISSLRAQLDNANISPELRSQLQHGVAMLEQLHTKEKIKRQVLKSMVINASITIVTCVLGWSINTGLNALWAHIIN